MGTPSGVLWFVRHATVPCREIKGEIQMENKQRPQSDQQRQDQQKRDQNQQQSERERQNQGKQGR